MAGNVGGMASKGLQVVSCQVARNLEAGYKPTQTTMTLIGYTACYGAFIFSKYFSINLL